MNTPLAVRRAASVMARSGPTDHIILIALLIRAGLSKSEAESTTRFVPLAFGREVLKGAGVHFSDTYILDGSELRLQDDPYFADAAFLAPVIAKETGPEVITRVALLSSEFQAINNALNAGSSIEGLVLSPPVMSWPEGVPRITKRKWWPPW